MRPLIAIAFAVTDIEKFELWEWFLSCLNASLRPMPNLTIVSNRQIIYMLDAIPVSFPYCSEYKEYFQK